MTLTEKYEQAKILMRDAGFNLGAHYIDEERGRAYVGSYESAGPDTYGHPMAEITVSDQFSSVASWRIRDRVPGWAVRIGGAE